MSQRRFLSVLAAFALAMASASVAVQPSFADDEDEPNFMSKLLGSVGLLQLPGPGVDYQERPPLVVPPITTYVQPQVQPNSPSAQPDAWNFTAPQQQQQASQPADNRPPLNNSLVLPPPSDGTTARQRNPNFPVDPEIKAAQKRKKKERMFSRAEDDPTYSGRRLTPAELRGDYGPVTKRNSPGTTDNDGQSGTRDIPVIGNLVRGATQKEQPTEFKGEPERQTLTQPPSGYLTPSANAPYGVVSKDRQRDTTRIVHPNMPDAPQYPGQ